MGPSFFFLGIKKKDPGRAASEMLPLYQKFQFILILFHLKTRGLEQKYGTRASQLEYPI